MEREKKTIGLSKSTNLKEDLREKQQKKLNLVATIDKKLWKQQLFRDPQVY